MLKAFALALLPTLLIAQEPAKDDLKDLQDLLKQPVIASASKRLQRLKEAPVDATVLSGEDLRHLGYHTLSEALDGVVGFRVVRDKAYDYLAVRGLQLVGDTNTRVLILLDGHALNPGDTLAESMVGEDFGIPLERVERIEITRGPASAMYGNGAFMGMVNVVTRAPSGRGELALGAQSRGGFEGWGRAGWAGSNSTWEITGSGFQRKGTALDFPELGVGTLPADLDREERQSAYLRAKGKEWSLTGYAMNRTQRQASAPYGTVIGDPRNFFGDSLVFGEFKAEPKFGVVDTFLRVFADHYVWSGGYSYNGARDPSITTPFLELERDPSDLYGLEVQARFPLLGQMVTVGSEQKWSRYRTSITAPDLQISSQVNSQSGNTYLQLDGSLGAWANLVLGVQQATQRITRADQLALGVVTNYRPSELQGWTPRLALVVTPTSVDIVKLLYGGGYRYPSHTERFYGDNQAYLANPALLPETIRTAEAIWVRIWGGGIQSQLGLSDSRWNRLIQYEDAGNGFIQARNEPGAIHSQSAEMEVTGRHPGWTWMFHSGVYNWVKEDGTRFPDCAHLQGGLRVTRLWGPWSVTGEARFVSRRENPARNAVAPATTTLRTALRWEDRQVWVSASIEDLTNARRVDLVSADYDPIARMVSDGRTGRISLGWRF